MKQLFFILLAIGLSSSGFSQKLVKIKFKSASGSILYYTAMENSDQIYYCDLYFTPNQTTKANKVKVLSKKIEEDELIGSWCIPTKITLGGKVYRCEIEDYKYINLVDEKGTKIIFKSID
jgi:hypothetical protein